MKILLVEDDIDVSETVTSVFTSFFKDTEVVHIVDGEGFRKGRWREGGWDIVVLDLMMPGITGFEVCEQLRAYPTTRNVPILALTGYDTLQNEERIKASGASGYLAKPFEVSTFHAEVERLLGGEEVRMESTPLDKEMDALIERLARKEGISSDAYGTDPLAADHLLLRQSWGFFKRRIATLENQWREISDAKSEEIQILKKQISTLQERLRDVEMEQVSNQDFLRAMEMARLEDHEKFRKEKDRLTQRWEEERVALEGDRLRVEQTLKQKEERLKSQEELLRQAKKEQDGLRLAARMAEIKFGENQAELAKSLNENILDKDSLFQSEQLKTDLLRREVERRDQLLSESTKREKDLLAQVKMLEFQLLKSKESAEITESQLAREKEESKRLLDDRARLLDEWQKEKSQWRELWDRKRTTE